LAIAIAFLCSGALAQDAGVEFGVEDDLTVQGTEGTSADADVEIKGYTVFGASGAGATVVTQGAGNVYIDGALEVGSNVTAVSFSGDGSALTGVTSTPSGAAGGDLSGTYPNPSIGSGVIVDADVNASAAIAPTKISGTALTQGTVHAGDVSGVWNNLQIGAGVVDTNALDSTVDDRYVNETGDTMTGALNLPVGGLTVGADQLKVTAAGYVGIGTATPSNALDVAGKLRVSDVAGYGLFYQGNDLYLDFPAGNEMFIWGREDSATIQAGIEFNGDHIRFRRSGAPSYPVSMVIENDSGEVGIGTESPAYPLHIAGTNNVNAEVQATSADSIAGLSLKNDARVYQMMVRGNASYTDQFIIRDQTDNEDRLVITTNGNVGIGTTGIEARLHVSGYVNASNRLSIKSTDGANSTFYVGHPQDKVVSIGGNTDHAFQIGGFAASSFAPRVTVHTSGRVGVGTTNPVGHLTVDAGTNVETFVSLGTYYATASKYLGLNLSRDFGPNWGFSGIEFGPPLGPDEGYLALHTHDYGATSASDERMRIDKNGNVGIGTTSPSNTLDVVGRIRSKGSAADTDPNGTVIVEAFAASGNRDPAIKFKDGDGTMLSEIQQELTGSGTPVHLSLRNYMNGDVRIATSNTVAMTVSPAGNVGVGETSPAGKLHVVGGDTSGDYAMKIYAGSNLAAWVKKK